MRVAVFGAGAVGLGLASFLIDGGARVHLHLRRREAADALARRGLSRTGALGDATAAPGSFGSGTALEEIVRFAPDFVLVCTKSPDRERVARELERIAPALPGAPPLVLCLNGWGAAERLTRRIPAEQVFNATVTTGFRRHGDHRVEVTVHGDELHLGSLFGADATLLTPLCEALTKAGLPSAVTADMESELWAKLLYNCALNPLAALLGVPYGALAEDPARRAILETVVREIFAVLAATERTTRWDSADDYLAFFFADLLPATRDHESSMLQDLRAGRTTEIDALCGAVVELGRQSGVQTPVNAALAALVRARHPLPA